MQRWAGVDVAATSRPPSSSPRSARAGHRRRGRRRVGRRVLRRVRSRASSPRSPRSSAPLILRRLAGAARRARAPQARRPATALRFEAYVGGLELANAFDELTDPVEQRARFDDDQRVRRARGRRSIRSTSKLLAALAEGLPPCGRDRARLRSPRHARDRRRRHPRRTSFLDRRALTRAPGARRESCNPIRHARSGARGGHRRAGARR